MKTIIRTIAILSIFWIAGCGKEMSQTGLAVTQVRLSFISSANGLPLLPETQYFNFQGEDFQVTKFKFYISNIALKVAGSDQFVTEEDSYHLVDGLTGQDASFLISLPKNAYSQIRFMVGVDSARNNSGAQSGALDPANGMFWTWNSGYIMAKLEGRSSYSTEPDQLFEYHIGGFKGDEKTQRVITLLFPPGSEIHPDENKIPELKIGVNLDHWFNGVHPLTIAGEPSWTTPGGLATQYADNYATMFGITQILNQ